MSSVGEETELNFDFHGVLLCVRASSLRDEMESSEKRREEMDLAQRRGMRWRKFGMCFILLITSIGDVLHSKLLKGLKY
ncbi:hypothetical protein F2Q69_00044421 [Brassica cretica]|uniref:Transmembrane protein n=1 Tax=Brassica cretica TaxID=69181 RepID=A0A8S9NHE2_BRACR|nr:hypothetical protein F2Q69_00044421 [Brassica cretica]